jgi:hypothetical protein
MAHRPRAAALGSRILAMARRLPGGGMALPGTFARWLLLAAVVTGGMIVGCAGKDNPSADTAGTGGTAGAGGTGATPSTNGGGGAGGGDGSPFACGGVMCEPADYCVDTVFEGFVPPDTYTCEALPPSCLPTPTCACLEKDPDAAIMCNGFDPSECEDSDGHVTIRCEAP